MTSEYELIQTWRRPNIVPRKRKFFELCDLATRIIGKLFRPLVGYFFALAAPVYLINCALTFWCFGLPEATGGSYEAILFKNLWPAFLIWVAISLETLFIGSLATQYLGIWLFSAGETITPRRVFREWRSRWGQVVYFLVVTRLIRRRPFYPEVILLERHPFRAPKGRMTTKRRVAFISLRGVGIGAGFSWLLLESFLTMGVLSGYFLLAGLLKSIFADPNMTIFLMNFIFFPIFVFCCKLFNVVFYFCEYINYRISCEGWDVDLAMKTELVRYGDVDEIAEAAFTGRRNFHRSRTLAPLVMEDELNDGASSLSIDGSRDAEEQRRQTI